MEQSDVDLLQTVPPYHLQALARVRRMPKLHTLITSSSASSLPVSQIADLLFAPEPLREAIRSLNELETSLLRELAACGGRANSRDLALYMTASGMIHASKEAEHPAPGSMFHTSNSPIHYPAPHPHGAFEQALRQLLLTGLVFWGKQTHFAGRDYANGVYDGVLIVPYAVRELIDEQIQQERLKDDEASQLSEEHVSEAVRSGQRLLYLYWSLVASQREGLPLVSSGLLARSALRQIMEALQMQAQIEQVRSENELPRLLFWRLLLMKLGLLYERNGVIYAAPAEAFFSLPLLERVRRCCRLWLETPFWNEILYLPDVVVRPGPTILEPAHEEVVHARQTVVRRLLQEPLAEWRDITAFVARTKLYAPYLLFPRQYGARADRYSQGSNPYGWDFRLKRGWLTHREGWYQVEGSFIRAVVQGPLHWLGLIEVRREEQKTLFCLDRMLKIVARREAFEGGEITPGRLIVQPNFDLVVLAPVSEGLLVRLDRFAERTQLEHIAQYHLSKASVVRAIQTGMQAADIQKVLEEATGGAIPQNVLYSLNEWERQARRIEVWQNMVLLEVQDTTLLERLLQDEEASSLLGRRLSPTLIAVRAAKVTAIQELLWRWSYLPALTPASEGNALFDGGEEAEATPQWRLQENGLLQPLYAVSDMYLQRQLERISEEDRQSGLRKVTPASVQQALQQGMMLDMLLRFLNRYCLDGVPASFLIRLKLWGNGYGARPTIHVERSPLLYLPEEVLRDILADSALGDLLGSAVPSQGRLVRISQESLERVLALLRERGFLVEDGEVGKADEF